MAKHQLIDAASKVVVNSIELDDPTRWTPPEGVVVIPDERAGPGWSYDDATGEFTPPVQPAPGTGLAAPISRAEAAIRAVVLKGVITEADIEAEIDKTREPTR